MKSVLELDYVCRQRIAQEIFKDCFAKSATWTR
jgi:hypothetical protein